MSKLIGILVILFGIALGLYISIWWGFICGIVAIVEAVKADPVVPLDLAMGIARVVFCNFLGVISGGLVVVGGIGLCSIED